MLCIKIICVTNWRLKDVKHILKRLWYDNMKLTPCFYKPSSTCFWMIGLLLFINFWLISRFKSSQSPSNDKHSQTSHQISHKCVESSKYSIPVLTSSTTSKKNGIPLKSDDKLQGIFKSEIINVDLGRFDMNRTYKLFDNVLVGDKFIDLSVEYDVTLATQSSLDKIHWISHIVRYVNFSNH